MRRTVVMAGLVVAAFATLAPGRGTAQVNAIGDAARSPRFLVATLPNARPVPLDIERMPVLGKRLTLDLDGVSLKDALLQISIQSGLVLAYSDDLVNLDRRIELRASGITVVAALTDVLYGAGVDVVFNRDGRASLVRRDAKARVAVGTIVGRVTDGKTGDPVVGAEVFLEGTRWRVTSGDKGYFRMADVEPGTYTLLVRRVGYAKQTRSITVTGDQELTIDVTLDPVVTQLDEIVTTVTGEQRVRELGHVVGRINADSLVKEAPISTLSELLNARVPGLQVFTASGVVGGTAKLQIRSPNSLLLGTEPILIVDGVRYTTTATGYTGLGGEEETSRLNDINPNDIASVEVVKGPSAATLYGTDASNGVIVVTTKRGTSGRTRWNGYMRATESSIPKYEYPDSYWGWGTVFGTPNSAYSSCTLRLLALEYCTQQDSITRVPNPLNDPNYTIFHNEPSWQYGINTSGGRQELRYYFSGDYEDETGAFQMPRQAIENIKLARGVSEIPIEELKPNAQTRGNLRANVTAVLARTAELQINSGYTTSSTRTIASGSGGAYGGSASATPTKPFGDYSDPQQLFAQTSTESLDRFINSVSAQWRPLASVQARATVGFDLATNGRYSLARPGEGRFTDGVVTDARTRQLSLSGDVGVSATLRRGRATFRTSVGAQYARSLTDMLYAQGYGLPPGGESPGQASSFYLFQVYDETATLGGYGEETFGLNDRLFLTAALRVDGATAFGSAYSAATYPKVSASWIVSEEPFMPKLAWLDELRVRFAIGASGRQAFSYMALPDYGLSAVLADGQVQKTAYAYSLGNPNLKPEKVREHEFGVDVGAFNSRARLGLTWFSRRTIDPIVTRNLSPGFGPIYTNFGEITGRGFEAELGIRPIDSRMLSWQVTLNHALHRSTLVDLGDYPEYRDVSGNGYVEHYSLGARFSQKILGYEDINNDGIIAANEVQYSDMVYVGESTPSTTQTLTSAFGLFNQRVRISTLFERRAGYTQTDAQLYLRCSAQCREAVDITTPLAEQAEIISLGTGSYRPIEDGTFVRFRELTAAVDLPERLARAMRVRNASLSLSVRNLALWSSFSGPDPESAPVNGFSGNTASAVPQGRTYVLRFDLGL